jgi:cytochrome b561
MRKVVAVLATLLLVGVVVQFFLAASGAFNTDGKDEAFQPHRAMGYVVFILAVLLTIAAALARMPGRLTGMAGLVAGLIVLQVLIATAADAFNDSGDNSTTAGTLIFGLHALNGLAILGVSQTMTRRAWALSKQPAVHRPERTPV